MRAGNGRRGDPCVPAGVRRGDPPRRLCVCGRRLAGPRAPPIGGGKPKRGSGWAEGRAMRSFPQRQKLSGAGVCRVMTKGSARGARRIVRGMVSWAGRTAKNERSGPPLTGKRPMAGRVDIVREVRRRHQKWRGSGSYLTHISACMQRCVRRRGVGHMGGSRRHTVHRVAESSCIVLADTEGGGAYIRVSRQLNASSTSEPVSFGRAR